MAFEIVRFYDPRQNKPSEVIRVVETLEEAQEHCEDPSTSVSGKYFDGYRDTDREPEPDKLWPLIERLRELGV